MLETVQVGHDKQEVACLLDRKEPGPGHIDTASLLETLHGRPHSGLQLVDADAALQLLGVDDDLHVEGVLLQHPLDGRQTDPQVVGVKHVELLHRLKVFLVFFWNLEIDKVVMENDDPYG